jgi:hypothetical protein
MAMMSRRASVTTHYYCRHALDPDRRTHHNAIACVTWWVMRRPTLAQRGAADGYDGRGERRAPVDSGRRLRRDD